MVQSIKRPGRTIIFEVVVSFQSVLFVKHGV